MFEQVLPGKTKSLLALLGKSKILNDFYYRYPIASLISWEGISIANQEDIAPMKLAAIAHRGTKRDFVDLFFYAENKIS